MQTKIFALLALSASAALASPFHRRQNLHHHDHGVGVSAELPMPTRSNTNAPFPASNDPAGGLPAANGDFDMTTNTVSPVPATSVQTELSSIAKIVAATDVEADSHTATCTTISTAGATFGNYVPVTAKDLAVAPTVNAGGFYGSHSWGGGVPGASTTSEWASNISATISSIASGISTILTAAASGGGASATAAPSMQSTPSDSFSSIGSKKGIPYNSASLVSVFGNAVSWAYNWGDSADGLSGVEYIPMCWGRNNVGSFSSGGASHVLSFNEPDLPAQANMDPSTAAELHKQVFSSIRSSGVQVGSPAVTNGEGSSMGISWLEFFFDACGSVSKGCPVDFVAFHWYGTSIDNFKSHTYDMINTAAKNGVSKVWITEFAPSGSASDQAWFMSQAVPFLDSTAVVERYAAFMASNGTLLSGSSLNSVGSAYVA